MRVLPTVTLTSNQKRVLAKIVASPTPKVAGEEISGDRNLTAARDQLAALGAVEYMSGEATITDKGNQLAQEENITDESGKLTQDGETLAYSDASGKQDKDETRAPSESPPMGVPAQTPPVASAPPGGNSPGAFDLTMSDTPEYGNMKLLQELLDEARKIRRPGWGRKTREHGQQFAKSGASNTPATFEPASTMSNRKTTGGVLPQSFKQFYEK